MAAPTFKKATDSDAGDSTKYGSPDVKYIADVLDATHTTDRIQATSIETTGTNVQADLDLKAPLTSATLVTPALGTPTSGVLTNCTGLPFSSVVITGTPDGTKFVRDDGSFQTISGGGDALVANPTFTVRSNNQFTIKKYYFR